MTAAYHSHPLQKFLNVYALYESQSFFPFPVWLGTKAMVGAAENPDYGKIWNPCCRNSLERMSFVLPVRRETVILILLFQPTAQKITLNFFSLGSKSNIYFKPVQKIRRLKKQQKGKC